MSSRKKLLLAVLLVVIVVVGGGLYFFFQYQSVLKNPVLAAKIERESLTKKIGTLIELPSNEQPTVATVSDSSKLKNQPFFAKAKNGDKLLIYSKAKKAILYDPKANKIVEVGPINVGQTSSQSAQPAIVKVALYNGTKDVNLLALTEKTLKEKITNIAIMTKANAAKSDYKKTIVIDLTNGKPNVAKQLAAFLGGEVGSLPKGQIAPKDVEILVVLGK